jgi:translation elongation factor aEF-1 beta
MGMVGLTLRVMLESPDTDVLSVKKSIEKIASPKQITEKPVAFGLKMLEVLLIFDDKKGADIEKIEESIRSIDGVSSVESGDVTLIS